MPGTASLDAGRYYAHPRNQFWPFIEAIFGIPATDAYADRCRQLADRQVALWDVLRSCQRPGSLDAAIVGASVVANDFAGFLDGHPCIHSIFFNGAKAEQLFIRQVIPQLGNRVARLHLQRLPSTSPANASIPKPDKLAAWRRIRDLREPPSP